jgi:ribonuclease III
MTAITLPKFKNNALLQQALTHRSLPNHNERFEFLGDGILQGVVTAMLVQRFPNDQEGLLSLKRSALVRNTTLAKIAKRLNLDEQLLMDASAEKQGCRCNSRILSDTLEAVVGAYFIDSGCNFGKVEHYVRSLFTTLQRSKKKR